MANFPKFYDQKRVGTLYYPDLLQIATDARKANLLPASQDKFSVLLLIVDMQVDFCHPQGSLYVPGAEMDVVRVIEFIYRNAEKLTHITASLDSHLPFQIFHAAWWTDNKGNHPSPYTIITVKDVEEGVWRPTILPDWSKYYVAKLEEYARKALVIWPYHVPIGGVGNMLDSELWSAIFWHAIARQSQPTWMVKGRMPKTEHYSIIQPEIPVPEDPEGGRKDVFLEDLRSYQAILIAGEAESHCVLETLEDLVEVYRDEPELLTRMYVLKDCMSPVVHPEIDFHGMTMVQFSHFAQKGINFINSTDNLPF